MKLLNKLWPWSRIADLERQLAECKSSAAFARQAHHAAYNQLARLQEEHEKVIVEHARSRDGIRKMAEAFVLRGLDKIALILMLFFGFSADAQPIIRQLFDTNPPPLLSSISGPMVITNGAGKPELTFNGAGLTNLNQLWVTNSADGSITNLNGGATPVRVFPSGFVAANSLTVSNLNLQNLNAGGVGNGDVPVVIYRQSVVLDDQGNTASNIVLFAVPANCLGTNKSVKVEVYGDYLQSSGGNANLSLSWKYGSTTLWGDTVTIGSGAQRQNWHFYVTLRAANATNAQQLNGFFWNQSGFPGSIAGSGNISGSFDVSSEFKGNSGEDSTTTLNLVLVCQWSTSTSVEFKVMSVTAICQ